VKRNPSDILVENPKAGKRPPGRPRCNCGNNTEFGVTKIPYESVV
jgi:hypothetical protein